MKKNNEKINYNVTDYLIFKVGDNFYSIFANSVLEVITEHALTNLPFVPDYIDGLINIKGQVIPQLNLKKFFLSSELQEDLVCSELIIVETSRSPCALKIDKLIGKFSIESKNIKSINNISEDGVITENTNKEAYDKDQEKNNYNIDENGISKFICGEFIWNNEIVLVLEPDYFGEVINSKEAPVGKKGLLGKSEDIHETSKNNTIDCLVVNNGQEKYALKLKDILEIIKADEITALPGSPDEIVGITMVRDNPLVILSLSAMLGKSNSINDSPNIVIIERGETLYGLHVDGIEGIYYFNNNSLQIIDDDSAELSGVLTTETKDIIGLIQPEYLINDEAHKVFLKYVPERIKTEEYEEDQCKSVLQVTIGAEEYAIPLNDINKIVEYKEPEIISNDVNDKIVGAVDINGTILPVLDLYLFNSRNSESETEDDLAHDLSTRSFVIIGIENSEWALKVSEAREIIELPLNNIEQTSGSDSGFIDGIANIGEQLISLINVQAIFNSDI